MNAITSISRNAFRGRTDDGRPNPIDTHVGARIRLRRTLLGISQEKLGEALGLSFQQVQKYERGANRVGASRLYDLARVLDVPVGFFFDDIDAAVAAASPAGLKSGAAVPDMADDPTFSRETLELVRAYLAVDPPDKRRAVLALLKALGGEG